MRITVPAPAKVNLWLRIGELEPSGFHDLDTLFCALDLADTITVRSAAPGTGIRLDPRFAPPIHERPDLGPAPENLAVRAATAFLQRAGLPPDARIRLVKRIPPGGGLGGGSSDAAAVLRGLARLHHDAVPQAALQDIAAELGSDVPFFAVGHALSRGLGRGVDLRTATPPPARAVLLALPPLSIPTADAYRWLDQARDAGRAPAHPHPPAADLPDPIAWPYLAGQARNDFEPVIFDRYPGLRALRDTMVRHGADLALLAGSGSTVFGVFDQEDAAHAAARAVRDVDPAVRTVVTRTRSR